MASLEKKNRGDLDGLVVELHGKGSASNGATLSS